MTSFKGIRTGFTSCPSVAFSGGGAFSGADPGLALGCRIGALAAGIWPAGAKSLSLPPSASEAQPQFFPVKLFAHFDHLVRCPFSVIPSKQHCALHLLCFQMSMTWLSDWSSGSLHLASWGQKSQLVSLLQPLKLSCSSSLYRSLQTSII